MIDFYTCEQAFARVFEYLDRELSSDEEALVSSHLAVCEGCAHHFQFEADLLATIRDKSRSALVPCGLRERIERMIAGL